MTARIRKAYRRAAAQPIVVLKSAELTPEKGARVSEALRRPSRPIVLDPQEDSITFLHISCKSWARLAADGDDRLGAEARRWLVAKGLRW